MKDLVKYILEMTSVQMNSVLERATEEEKEKQRERSKKYGISIKDGGNVTKPKEYSNVPDDEFADPVNYRYPIDAEHILPAIRYFNQKGMRLRGEYSPEEWAIMGKRIARQATILLKTEYEYVNGKIKRAGQ